MTDHPIYELARSAAVSTSPGTKAQAFTRRLETLGLGDDAAEFEDALTGARKVVQTGLGRARKLAANDEGDPAGLDRSWEELGRAIAGGAGDAIQQGRKALDRIDYALLAKAVPAPSRDAAARLAAREEIQLRINSASAATRGTVALELASSSDPAIRAELASGWGKAYAESVGGLDHTTLIGRVVKTEAEHGSKAAATFLDADQLGHRLRAAEEAAHHASTYMRPGRTAHRRPTDRENRHADLRDLAAAGRTDAAA